MFVCQWPLQCSLLKYVSSSECAHVMRVSHMSLCHVQNISRQFGIQNNKHRIMPPLFVAAVAMLRKQSLPNREIHITLLRTIVFSNVLRHKADQCLTYTSFCRPVGEYFKAGTLCMGVSRLSQIIFIPFVEVGSSERVSLQAAAAQIKNVFITLLVVLL